MKIVAMVGSNRQDSYNMKLTRFLQKRYTNKVEIEILPIDQLPFYNQDEEFNPPTIVKEIKDKILLSDGILIATPEYNGSISGMLKNALDWFSRVDQVMVKKPVMIVGASMGAMGTIRAQMQLRQILNAPGIGALTLPGNEVFIGSIQNKMDEQGNLTDEPTIEFVDSVIDNFVDWTEKTKVFS
ncbi:MAG: NADPH-dependent FMN reductase [Bacillota bacterium]|uniref:NAD(P)H-dependent oxidoreductase n=1 Tax=Virgibacillus salarius TaxID=447199 RepID=A0A941DQD1_9BACI|nr:MULTISPECIES: NADPH-dependent FMN reductase [Bacillaceae]NAZ07312.1 NADPH-dependent FMN reductase [Agaribacter marinus]MBR7794590.1 NAD(P)H-dependent oxidoreductase [Virgibacillus salarius]MCC2252472.1 NAD(P)H-dependent oxidoreductase [Virgibacillus sp. AGTR]MDY7045493.1 NADPH-dependent FMN reductase [Virgibacillus sp. M23]QRZ16333.1 NAD(P)H-dependent oxidoreductase [Virgibacillus sp. AGTR]